MTPKSSKMAVTIDNRNAPVIQIGNKIGIINYRELKMRPK